MESEDGYKGKVKPLVREALERVEDAALELGRAQAEGRRATRERQRLWAAWREAWEVLLPLVVARSREMHVVRHRLWRVLAALIMLPL